MQLLGWEADQAQVATQRVQLSVPCQQGLVLGHLHHQQQNTHTMGAVQLRTLLLGQTSFTPDRTRAAKAPYSCWCCDAAVSNVRRNECVCVCVCVRRREAALPCDTLVYTHTRTCCAYSSKVGRSTHDKFVTMYTSAAAPVRHTHTAARCTTTMLRVLQG